MGSRNLLLILSGGLMGVGVFVRHDAVLCCAAVYLLIVASHLPRRRDP